MSPWRRELRRQREKILSSEREKRDIERREEAVRIELRELKIVAQNLTNRIGDLIEGETWPDQP